MNRILRAALVCASVGISTVSSLRASEPNLALHCRQPGADVKYVAHQGEERLAVNHSIAAYRIAAEHKCDYLKLDVRETKDGVIVTQHDEDLRAIYGTKAVIAMSTLAELRRFTRSKGEFPDQHICTLDEALEVAKTMPGVWLDFKHYTKPFADKVMSRVLAAGIPEERVLVGTWSKPALKYMGGRYPKTLRVAHTYVRGEEGAWQTNTGDQGEVSTYATLEALTDGIIARCRKSGLQGVNMPAGLDQKFASPDWMIKKLKESGLYVSMWFVKDFRQGRFYRDAGADAFVMMDKAWTGAKTDDARPLYGVCAWCKTIEDVKTAVTKKAEMIGFSQKDGLKLEDVHAQVASDRTWIYCDVDTDVEAARQLAQQLVQNPSRRRQTILAGAVPVLTALKKEGFYNQPRAEHPRLDFSTTRSPETDKKYAVQAATLRASFLAVNAGFDCDNAHRQFQRTVYFGPCTAQDVPKLHDAGFDFIVLPVAETQVSSTAVSGEPLVRAAFAFDGLAGYLGWEALSVDGGAASADRTAETGPDGSPVMRLTGTAKACTFETIKLSLVGGEPYRFSAWVRIKGLGRSAGTLSLGGLQVGLPGETDGKWVRVTHEGLLPKAKRNQQAFSFQIKGLKAGAVVDLSNPKLEPLSDKAVAGSSPAGAVVPLTPRIVPVEPLLSAVDARTGMIRFRANVPTNGCEIVATVDGKPLGPMAEGRHEVVVKLVETATGKVKAANAYPFLAVLPKPEKTVGKRLNNFVVEVLKARLKDGAYAFENPRKGWVFIGFDRPHENTQAFLNGIDGPVITYREGEPSETMRYLNAGAYTLTVKGATGGGVRIHLIKPVMVGFLNSWREGGFKDGALDDRFGFEFMRKNAFASMADVNIRFQPFYHRGSTPERRAWVIDQLRLRGKRPLAVSSCAVSERKSRQSLESQRKLFVNRQTFRDGYPVSYDENGLLMSMRDLNCCGEAAWELASLLDPRPIYMDWFSIQGETIRDFNPVVAVMSAIANSGLGTGLVVSETYIGIHGEEARFEKSIRNLKDNQRALAEMMPEMGRRIAHNLCGFQQIGSWTSHLVPQVDRKVAMEQLANRLANDPDFADVGGLSFTVARCGEELLRWGAKVIHHYAIEGRTDSMSEAKGWKYFPETVTDGDFLQGLSKWKAAPAEMGSLTASSRVGFARNVQKRNCAAHEEGDFFAVLTRSAKGPNRLSQQIRNLVPGKRYVLEYACSDLADVERPGTVAKPDLTLRAEVVGMPFDPFFTVENVAGETKGAVRVSSRRYVFEATAPEAELVFSDWATDTEPGGASGRALALNYIAVTPYFEPAPGQLD